MILHAIELTNVGRFRETVRIGPFGPGFNVIAAPNESGKSTSLRGAAHGLFDKHTTGGVDMKTLQPAGTDLIPRIAVEFETRDGRFRIEKTFLKKPTSFLRQWQSGEWKLIAEADAADLRVQTQLKSTFANKGASRPEHWGLLGFLWARQDDPAQWPTLTDSPRDQSIRSSLVRIEIDPVIEKLRAKLEAVAESVLTGKGQSKTGGPLALAEAELEAIETALADLRRTCAEVETAQQVYQQAEAKVTQLEVEHADREKTADLLRKQSAATERLRGELSARQQALKTAREKLNAITTDEAGLNQGRMEIETATQALATAEKASASAQEALDNLRSDLDKLLNERGGYEAKSQSLRTELHRTQSLLKLRQQSASSAALSRQLEQTAKAASELATHEEQRARLPLVPPAKLRKLEELTEEIRTLRAQVQALGLTLELTPDASTSVKVLESSGSSTVALPAGKATRLQSPSALDLHIAGWGRMVIRSGGQEAQHAAASLAKAQAALQSLLEEIGLTSLDAVREAVASRRDLDQQIKSATAALASLLGEHATVTALRDAAAVATRRAEAAEHTIQPTPAEQEQPQADLEASESRLLAAAPAADKALKDFDARVEQFRTQERKSTNLLQESTRLTHDQGTKLRTLETRSAAVMSRYPDGLEAAKKAAQIEFGQAEARVTSTEAELPKDFERLPERNRRAAAALQETADQLTAQRSIRDRAKGTLESQGGMGLYSRETELEEKKTEVLLRRDAALALGWTTRLTHDLIRYRKQAATKAVLNPLEERLTAAFADLTGVADRRIYLDENLRILGLGRTRDDVYPFDSLSQGAKEQLMLCLRIAVAQELAQEEPQLLVLDDVLVNTDATRQERVLDVLSSLANKLQIIVLTCHEDRYRGVGQRVSLPL